MQKKLLFTCLLFFLMSYIFAQNKYEEYWKASLEAMVFYNKADYEAAAEAFKNAFKLEHIELPRHRLYAAASNCMIDNEVGVRENLFASITTSTKDDIKRVLVNYEIFNKYKHTDWWKELEQKLNERLKNLIAHHKNLHIFKKGRNIKYKAIRINKNGDTLANTFIVMKPDGTGWGDEAASLQSQVIYEYEYNLRDSIQNIEEVTEVVGERFWLKHDTTGVIENQHEVWIHPFRNNQFFKTELAPFPTVMLPISKEKMAEHKPKVMILKNWGKYSGSETESEYSYIGKEFRTYNCAKDLPCHKFQALGLNMQYGLSEIEYYFNEDLGFTEMIYMMYDGDKILFLMDEIITE